MMDKSVIGAYGGWLAEMLGEGPGKLSFRRDEFSDLDTWRVRAKARVWECMAAPQRGPVPEPRTLKTETYDGLIVEHLEWDNPAGSPTQAVFLKPEGSVKNLPGLVGLHDHGGNKYLGRWKIARGAEPPEEIAKATQHRLYSDKAWANELAKRGYAVLVHDAFAFGSRIVRPSDVTAPVLGDLPEKLPQSTAEAEAYNNWAGRHESIMAKSILSAGTTWPALFVNEDQRALDYLCARDDVDASRVGCAGLSGGGLRTVFLGGLDDRIKCAVCVGMMTTWRDFLLNKSWTHTWMSYVPLLPRDLDYPEILGLRVPMPVMVLNNEEDPLFTPGEMRRAERILAEIYNKAGVPENYVCKFYPGPHKFDAEMQACAFDWLDKHLKS